LLEEGKAAFQVVPGGSRQWIVEAGALSVEVVGTRFSVERTPTQVRVEVERGTVLDRSAFLEPGVTRLEAGGRVDVAVPQVTNSKEAVHLDDLEISDSSTLGSAPLADDRRRADTSARETKPEPATANQLVEAADSARRRGEAAVATAALETLLNRYPQDLRAGAARFQLARLYLELTRYDDARRTLKIVARGSGPLSEDAYLRLVELEKGQGGAGEAVRLADEYLKRFPKGRHVAFFSSISAGP
jgi:transmembrane sensor